MLLPNKAFPMVSLKMLFFWKKTEKNKSKTNPGIAHGKMYITLISVLHLIRFWLTIIANNVPITKVKVVAPNVHIRVQVSTFAKSLPIILKIYSNCSKPTHLNGMVAPLVTLYTPFPIFIL